MKNPCAFDAYLGNLLAKWTPAVAAEGFLGGIQPAIATTSGAEMCMESARRLALVHGIPPSALRSLAVKQSGKLQDGAMLPWPWTVEVGGIRRWFSDRQAASDFVEKLQGQGHGPVKLGCFLVGLAQHGTRNSKGDSPIEPGTNADLAARQLIRAFALTGSWEEAVRNFDAAFEGPPPVNGQSNDIERAETGPATSVAPPEPAFTKAGVGSLVSFGTNGTALSFWQESE